MPTRALKDTYEASVTSRCWAYTPYEVGWDGCPELRADADMAEILCLEAALAPVPTWAQAIVERSINFPPFCPHYAFPQPYLDVLDAIGRQQPPTFVHGCYTADRQRKERLADYVLCLDAWRAGTFAEEAAGEVSRRSAHQAD
ncbi:MAG: hypothetical protein ACYC4R_04510 [Anaerolineae bacterium]